MRIGFTGTRNGMTEIQKAVVESFLEMFDEVHHGMCIGADYDFHLLAKESYCTIIGHPGVPKTGPCKTRSQAICDKTHPEKGFLIRDKDIVDATECLIATPKSKYEELRSGTWATVRYARKVKKPVVIVYPDGTSLFEVYGKKIEVTWPICTKT